jgi:protein arginine kinase
VLLSSEEAINLLSNLRLGICLGIIKNISLLTINILNILVKRANLMAYLQNENLSAEERDLKRALIIKKILKKKDGE